MTQTDERPVVDTVAAEEDRDRRDAIELFLQLCDLDENDLLEAVERLDTDRNA